MWNRKAKRIAELEQQLAEARHDLAIAVVPLGPIQQKIEVRKGIWYRASFSFQHTGGPILNLADLFVGEDSGSPPYFDGGTAWVTAAAVMESGDAQSP